MRASAVSMCDASVELSVELIDEVTRTMIRSTRASSVEGAARPPLVDDTDDELDELDELLDELGEVAS